MVKSFTRFQINMEFARQIKCKWFRLSSSWVISDGEVTKLFILLWERKMFPRRFLQRKAIPIQHRCWCPGPKPSEPLFPHHALLMAGSVESPLRAVLPS